MTVKERGKMPKLLGHSSVSIPTLISTTPTPLWHRGFLFIFLKSFFNIQVEVAALREGYNEFCHDVHRMVELCGFLLRRGSLIFEGLWTVKRWERRDGCDERSSGPCGRLKSMRRGVGWISLFGNNWRSSDSWNNGFILSRAIKRVPPRSYFHCIFCHHLGLMTISCIPDLPLLCIYLRGHCMCLFVKGGISCSRWKDVCIFPLPLLLWGGLFMAIWGIFDCNWPDAWGCFVDLCVLLTYGGFVWIWVIIYSCT